MGPLRTPPCPTLLKPNAVRSKSPTLRPLIHNVFQRNRRLFSRKTAHARGGLWNSKTFLKTSQSLGMQLKAVFSPLTSGICITSTWLNVMPQERFSLIKIGSFGSPNCVMHDGIPCVETTCSHCAASPCLHAEPTCSYPPDSKAQTCKKQPTTILHFRLPSLREELLRKGQLGRCRHHKGFHERMERGIKMASSAPPEPRSIQLD